MSPGWFTFVASPTPSEPTCIEVHKSGRAIGRILRATGIYQFHPGMTGGDLNVAAQFSELDELKKWIGETQ